MHSEQSDRQKDWKDGKDCWRRESLVDCKDSKEVVLSYSVPQRNPLKRDEEESKLEELLGNFFLLESEKQTEKKILPEKTFEELEQVVSEEDEESPEAENTDRKELPLSLDQMVSWVDLTLKSFEKVD